MVFSMKEAGYVEENMVKVWLSIKMATASKDIGGKILEMERENIGLSLAIMTMILLRVPTKIIVK